jgi:hypothetical protein
LTALRNGSGYFLNFGMHINALVVKPMCNKSTKLANKSRNKVLFCSLFTFYGLNIQPDCRVIPPRPQCYITPTVLVLASYSLE